MIYFKISDIVFSIDYSKLDNCTAEEFITMYLHRNLLEYICEPQQTNCNITFKRGENYIKQGEFISIGAYYMTYRIDNIIRFVSRNSIYDSSQFVNVVEVSDNWNQAVIIDYITKKERFSDKPCVGLFIGLFCYIQGLILFHNSFFIHGVALQYKNKNIVFSAGSGVGKTTHTNFWIDKFGAEILNGDSPIIKLTDDMPFIYGSPWCGTSNINVNKNVPLNAIVVLKRGNDNKIRKLNRSEAIKRVFPYMRRHSWDPAAINLCLDYCEKIVNLISVYELECLPNEESAEIALAGIEELHG